MVATFIVSSIREYRKPATFTKIRCYFHLICYLLRMFRMSPFLLRAKQKKFLFECTGVHNHPSYVPCASIQMVATFIVSSIREYIKPATFAKIRCYFDLICHFFHRSRMSPFLLRAKIKEISFWVYWRTHYVPRTSLVLSIPWYSRQFCLFSYRLFKKSGDLYHNLMLFFTGLHKLDAIWI